MKITRKSGRTLTVWSDYAGFYIRESLDRGRDVQTVYVSLAELRKIMVFAEDIAEATKKEDANK